MTAPKPRSLTDNEVREGLLAGMERCGSCYYNQIEGHGCWASAVNARTHDYGGYLLFPTSLHHAYRGADRDDKPSWFAVVAAGPPCLAYRRRQP